MTSSTKLDRRSTLLLQAPRSQTQSVNEKSLAAVEEPGTDALRGFFGKVGRIFRGRGSKTPTILDRRSTILLQAARSQTQSMDEESLTALEDPGMDILRGSFGTVGSIIRARSVHRMSQKSTETYGPAGLSWASDQAQAGNELQAAVLPLSDPLSGMKRHQLYDNPVPKDDTSSTRSFDMNSTSPRPNESRSNQPTIKFDSQDVVHQYDRPGTGNNRATHAYRSSPGPRSSTFVIPLQRKDSRDTFVDSPSSNTLKIFPSITESGRSGEIWDDEGLGRQKQLAEEQDSARDMGERYPKISSVDDAEESQRLFRRQSGGNELHEDIEIQATLNSASNLQLKSEQGEKTSGNSEQHPTTDLPENNENLLVGEGLDSIAGGITSHTGVVPTESQSIDQKVDFDIQAIWKFFFILTLLILMYFAGE